MIASTSGRGTPMLRSTAPARESKNRTIDHKHVGTLVDAQHTHQQQHERQE
jgi:hypothetical protein